MNENYKNKILNFYREKRRMPGYQEMMQMLGFKSKNAIYKVINKMVEAGLVDKDSQGRLTPKRLFGETPLLGLVEAGLPSPAEEQILDTVSLDELLIRNPDRSFILQVKGDSMIEAHIQEGDLVLVEKASSAKIGDVVVAEVDGDWTLKYYREQGGKPYLEPANKRFRPIHPEHSFRIGAIVRAVIRKFKN